MIFAYLLNASSSTTYQVLLEQDVLYLPSCTTLSKIIRQISGSTGLDNSAYLRLRVSKLNAFERTVISTSPKFDVEPTVSNANVIFYVSGAIARSTVRVTKCDSCREVLINSINVEKDVRILRQH